MKNDKQISKMYELLGPQERLALSIAACHRGDATDFARLQRATPTIHLEAPDYYRERRSLQDVSMRYVARQLEIAAQYWHLMALAQLDKVPAIPDAAKVLAYLYGLNAAGWRQFCKRIGVEPAAVVEGLPGAETVARFDSIVPLLTACRKEVIAFFNDKGGTDREIPTAEQLAHEMAKMFSEE